MKESESRNIAQRHAFVDWFLDTMVDSRNLETPPMKPLIGLTGRRRVGSDYIGQPDSLKHLEGDWYYADYARGVLAAGGLPVHLPLDADPAEFIDRLDGILIPGGADVWPERYGADVAETAERAEHERDDFELALLDAATAKAMPVLGICRGLQILNVHAGGTLHQHVPAHSRYDVSPKGPIHDISIVEGSQLAELYGNTHEVNSLHHQTVDALGNDLTVTATHEDGTVEGFEHNSLPILAVQWHPEMMDTRDTDPVFSWIVESSRT